MKIYTQYPEVLKLARLAFPAYAGRSFSVEALHGAMRLDSFWSGGSRDYYVLLDMGTGNPIPIPENGTPFSNNGQTFTLDKLPMNIAVIAHRISCGKDMGITVYVSPDNLNRFALPAPVNLTLAQQIVLTCTRERKSSYNGRNRQQMAEDDCGLPGAEWAKAKEECIQAGWLKANGAITDAGRNVCGTQQLWNLKWVSQLAA